MKDKMYFVIFLLSTAAIIYGLYEIISGQDAYNGGQGKVSLIIGVIMVIIGILFKKNDKPGR